LALAICIHNLDSFQPKYLIWSDRIMRLSKAAVQALLQAVSKNNALAVCNHSPPTQQPLRERIVQSSSAAFCSAEDLLSEAIKGYKKSEGITWNNYKETKEKS